MQEELDDKPMITDTRELERERKKLEQKEDLIASYQKEIRELERRMRDAQDEAAA